MHCFDLGPCVTSCFTSWIRGSRKGDHSPEIQQTSDSSSADTSTATDSILFSVGLQPYEALLSASLTNLRQCIQPSRKALQISLLQLESRLRDSPHKSGWTLPQIT